MGRRVPCSVPELCSICVGQIWSFLYSPFGIFSCIFLSFFLYKSLHEKIKSCNLNTGFCRFRREFNLGPEVLNTLVRIILPNKTMFVVLSFSRKPNAKIISFSYDYRQKVAEPTSVESMLKSVLLCLPLQKKIAPGIFSLPLRC